MWASRAPSTRPLQGVAYCGACKRRMWSETQVRPGRGEWRYYRCPGRLDRACDAPSVRAEPVEAFVIDHLASHVSPPEMVALMRAELAALRHLPGEELTGRPPAAGGPQSAPGRAVRVEHDRRLHLSLQAR